MWKTILGVLLGALGRLVPKRRLVRWACNEVGRVARSKKVSFLQRMQAQVTATPTNVDDDAWTLLLRLIDPAQRTPEMTAAMLQLIESIKQETKDTPAYWDDGIDLVLRQGLEV